MVFLVEGLYPTNDPQSSDDEDAPRTEGALRPAALLRAQAAAREERRVAEDQAKARRAAELRAALKIMQQKEDAVSDDAPLKKSNVMRRRAGSSVILTPHGRARMAARAITEEEILRARRVGRITRARDGRDGAARFKVEHDDIVYVTDQTLKTVFTTYRLPSAAWRAEGHPLIRRRSRTRRSSLSSRQCAARYPSGPCQPAPRYPSQGLPPTYPTGYVTTRQGATSS